MKKLKIHIFLILMLLLCGCSANVNSLGDGDNKDYTVSEEVQQPEAEEDSAYEDVQQPEDEADSDDQENAYTLEDMPEYSGQPFVELNGNLPEFSDSDKQSTEAFEIYSELDALGRCGEAYANICPELMPQKERGSIGQIKPSGWHTVKYNDLIDGNYLYNRCHLIGFQLAGENANEKNLITGTRYLNVEGMLPFEDLVDDYVDATGNHVLYRVTPVFWEDDLVAAGVEMEGWSVEDGGKGICFHVYCYNVQPGIEIDYATGDSWEAESGIAGQDDSEDDALIQEEPESDGSVQNQTDSEEHAMDFILNTNTMKFHVPGCSSVNDMAEKNKQAYTGTIEEIKGMGYTPCGRCLKAYR